MGTPLTDACGRVLETCAYVAAAAADVSIDSAALARLAARLAVETTASGGVKPPAWDECGWHYNVDAREGGPLTAQYCLVLDTLNFCFWPSTTDMEYDTLASTLRDVLLRDAHAFDSERLVALSAEELSSWFLPHHLPNAEERVRKLQEVGRVLAADFGGSFLAMVASVRNSAAALVERVASSFPGFRDEAVYGGRQVFLYKRAQIIVADVWAAYGQQLVAAPGAAGAVAKVPEAAAAAFYDIDRLTCFPDYRLPQLLRDAGAFVYSAPLAAAVDARAEVPAGSAQEVEIRACTVVAVGVLRDSIAAAHAALGGAAQRLTAVEVDWLLWQEGERRRHELQPHHRTRTVFY